LFFPITVIFFATINSVTDEKEKMLKEALEMVGLKPLVFWLGHYITTGVVVILNAFVTLAIGYACNFTFFAKTNAGVQFLLFVGV
jgi:hypothetical protein